MTEYLSYAMKGYIENYLGLPKACWQAIILTFIESLAIGISFFLSLYFVDILHFDIAIAGILISCYGIGTVLGGLLGGKLSDKISPKIVSAISLLLQAAAFLLLAQLTSLEWLMLNLFILGITAYGFTTSNDVWMLNQCKGQSEVRLKTVNISRAAMNLGLGLSGAIIGLVSSSGFQSIFYLSGAILFLSSAYLLTQKDTAPSEPIQTGSSPTDKAILKAQKANRKVFMLILTCLFAVGLLISQLSATYPIYVQDAFPLLGIKAVSILFILDTILIVLFQAPLVNTLKNHNKIMVAGLGAFLMGLGMLVLSFSFTFTLGLISCVIWTTGEMLFVPMAQLLCYEKGEEKKKGQSMGVYRAVYACSMVAGPTLGGIIYHYFGGNMLWYISAVMGCLCLAACRYYKKYD